MEGLAGTPDNAGSVSSLATAPLCIICQKAGMIGRAFGRGNRKYCDDCKASVPDGYHVCVAENHQGDRVVPVGMFYFIYRGEAGAKRPQSYCKVCGPPKGKKNG